MVKMNDDLQHLSNLSSEKRALLTLRRMQAKLDAIERARVEPIAIIGIGCRFPGGANDPESFWQLLRDGVDAITDIPSERWDVESYYDPNPETPNKMSTRWGGFLQQVDHFDPMFFGISPREAMSLDPQQRLLLEVAWEALEHAGQPIDRVAGSQTGVFIGASNSDHFYLQVDNNPITDAYLETGNRNCFAAGRLCYVFNFHGPAVVIDTVCSSSLVAVHMACQSLRAGECRMALAGGVNLILSPLVHIMVTKWGLMAPDGHCKTFDERANGFVRSEGCGLVVLKRLSDAMADGDPILALIRGSTINQDGRSNGLTAPNGQAQQALVRQAFANAGVDPSAASYIETHGTGSQLGDTIEVESLAAVMGQPRADGQPCLLGAVKTNIGHLEAAAGVAGLIKTVLALRHEMIPPNLNFQTLNPHIKLERTRFVLPTVPYPWLMGDTPRYAGVSSFGFSGTNAHVVLEEYRPTSVPVARELAGASLLLPISARTSASLRVLAKEYRDLLAAPDAPSVYDVCASASLRRMHHPHHRLAVVGVTGQDLVAGIDAFLQGEPCSGVRVGDVEPGSNSRLVFVFPGQGSQWVGMGRALLVQEPVFRAAIEECEQAFRAYVDWSLYEQLMGSADARLLHDIDVLQPTLCAIQIALVALWRAWGVTPAAVVGHSMGEVAAAYAAGILSLPDAARIICRRSALLRRIRGQGAMLLVEVSIAQAQMVLAPYADRVSVAVSNSARSTVLAGDAATLEVVRSMLEAQSVFCRWVKVDVASHSPQVDPLRDELLAVLEGVAPQVAKVPFYSTVTEQVCVGEELGAAYWVRNLREPVLFGAVIQRLIGEGQDRFIEISPHPILLPAMKQGLQERGVVGLAVASLHRDSDERAMLLGTLGALYTVGYPVSWLGLYPHKGNYVRLPSYPWLRQRYWIEPTELSRSGGWRRRDARGGQVHPLLGRPLYLATAQGSFVWEGQLGLDQLVYLSDHQVHDSVVLPAAAYIELVVAAASVVFGAGVYALERVLLHQMLVLVPDEVVTTQVVVTGGGAQAATVQVFSQVLGGDGARWVLHASAMVQYAGVEEGVPSVPERVADIQGRCAEQFSGAVHYQAMAALGFRYGPAFQGVTQLWRCAGEAVACVRLPDGVRGATTAYHIHPALLDACLQVIEATTYAVSPGEGEVNAYLPVEFQQVRLFRRCESQVVWVHARRRADPRVSLDAALGDVDLFDEDGGLFLSLRGLRMQRLVAPESTGGDALERWMYGLQWQRQPLPSGEAQGDIPGTWVIFTDGGGVGQQLARGLIAQGHRAVLVVSKPGAVSGAYHLDVGDPLAYTKLFQAHSGGQYLPYRGVIHLWSLDTPGGVGPVEVDPVLGWGSILPLVQALVQLGVQARLWLVTRGVQPIGVPLQPLAIEQSMQWGLGLTIAQECPALRCSRVDLSPLPLVAEAGALLAEVGASVFEDQVALREDGRYVARLVPQAGLAGEEALFLAGEKPFKLEVAVPGVLSGLRFRAVPQPVPGPGEVLLAVEAAGLNFLDVLLALDVIPDPLDAGSPQLGGEYAGRVVAVGAGVGDLQVGQEVIALAPGSFGTLVTAPRYAVVPKPAHLSFAEAAALPVAFLTAYYALQYVARLEPGERVLIHAASGGVGLAALQVARRLGAEVYATAGSPEKRAFLRSLGVVHVFDSRSLVFADEVRAATNGEGVDVVLNSLAGEFIAASFGVLRPYGRFIELGKRDYYQDRKFGLKPFLKNLSFTLVDVRTMQVERPALVQRLLHEVMALVEQGEFTPIVRQVVPVSQIGEAFQMMAQAKHMGKIAISFADRALAMIAPMRLVSLVRSDGTYVLTGGLGGIGLRLVRWLVGLGARYVVLIGRSAPSGEAVALLDELRAGGVTIVVCRADVADADAMRAVFAGVAADMPAVCGVFHAAAVLDDGVLMQQTPARFQRVLSAKVLGAWHLHVLTLGLPLDFFVLFSSVASLFGSPGQANYAAANAFLDALAYHRQALGLPALSINWGSWAEVGLAAQGDRAQRLAVQGVTSFTPDEGFEALGGVMRQTMARVGIVVFNLRQWQQAHPSTMALPLFAELRRLETHEGVQRQQMSGVRVELEAAEVGQRRALLEGHVRDQIAQVLRMAPNMISMRKPLGSMGFDSLTALEFRNRLEASLGLVLPGTLIWGYPTINALLPYLAERMGISLANQESPPESSNVPQVPAREGGDELDVLAGLGMLDEIDQLSDEQVRRMLSS